MKIIVKTKPSSKIDSVEKIDESNYIVHVKAPAVNGKANAALVKLLADYFKISQPLVEIISGHMSKNKIIKINI